MKEEESEEDGEELIDLEQENTINEKTNPKNEYINNKKTKSTNIHKRKMNKILIISLSIILPLILIFYLYQKYKNKISKELQKNSKIKNLIIFDFDKTLTIKDVFEEQRFLLRTKEEQEDIMERLNYENWTLLMSSFYSRIHDLNISISDINANIDKIEYNPGMIELLQYFENHKDKYSLVILSAGHYIQVIRALEKYNLTNLFDEIVAIPSHIENGKIFITQGHKYDCDICNVGQCKTFEYNLLIDKFKNKNISFEKVYYICDGLNDFCLARNLKDNDAVFVRENFTLYKALYEKGWINNMTCVVESWNDGYDIIDYIKKKEG